MTDQHAHEPSRFAMRARRLFDGTRMLADAAMLVDGGRIVAIGAAGDAPVDCPQVTLDADDLLAPGLVDWQVNGGGGVLLNDAPDAQGAARIAAAHLRHGTTALLPTLITDAPDKMQALAQADLWQIAGVVGVHLEGPFINRERRGVHPPHHIRAMCEEDAELIAFLAQRGACVVTLAPERQQPGAIARLAARGAIVSLGHSNACAADARRAVDEGARGVTHLFNAMSQLTGREPGLVGAALDDSRLFVGVIADGLHVDPMNLRLARKAIGPTRLALVSDAMPSVGAMSRGFDLMGASVRREGDRLTTADGTLAGAHLTMLEAARRMIRLAGASIEDALRMGSSTPAAFLQRDDIGVLRPGARADVIVLGKDLALKAVYQAGRRVPCVASMDAEDAA